MSDKELDINLEEMGDDAEFDNKVILTDEDGSDVEFEFIDLIEHETGDYVVLLPTEEETDEVVILKVESIPDDEENECYVGVDDDELLAELFEIFKEKFSDVFTFE